MAEIKFCGLTRPADAEHAVAAGADYVGVVLAPSPRQVTLVAARDLFASLGDGARRVGVFVRPSADDLVRSVDLLRLAAVQVHGALPADAAEIRERTGAAVWGVAGVRGAQLQRSVPTIARDVDVLLLDTSIDGRTGGSGRPFDWAGARVAVNRIRGVTRIALAGGLRPDNVAVALAALSPDIVDVSSGIEFTPGVKDHDRMTAFVAAVRGTVA